jgi:hypothetical protein
MSPSQVKRSKMERYLCSMFKFIVVDPHLWSFLCSTQPMAL